MTSAFPDITAGLVAVWMMLCALGGGFVILRLSGLGAVLSRLEFLAFGFVSGIGFIGWLAFFPGVAGYFSPAAFAAILVMMTGGLFVFFTITNRTAASAPLSLWEWVVVSGIVLMMAMDLCEALSPAADGDSMAYHFETPRRYLEAGAIYAIPRAIDGITQLLLQMTYGVAMGLGGAKAAPLWAMLSGWGLGAVFYVLARRHMPRLWALTGTLCLMTTPAVVYGAGTGQVEVRTASFALLSAYAAAMSVSGDFSRRQQFGWAVFAGLLAGFFAGTKMTGLIFVFACVLILVGRTDNVRRFAVFAAAAAVAGSQWYIFNAIQTGDPVYPLLWKYVHLADGFAWSAAYADGLKDMWASENPFARSLAWFAAYPFRTIIAPMPAFESLRTGVGPAALVLLPFTMIAALGKTNVHKSPLFRLLVVAFVFYALWFFFGASLRLRHLLPVYPIVLLGLFAGTAAYTARRPLSRRVLMAALAAVLALQLTGQAVFSKKYAAYVFRPMTAEQFLQDNISGYDAVTWLNQHLSDRDRVLVDHREWLYYLQVPYFFAHANLQTDLALLPGKSNPRAFFDNLAKLEVTHIALNASMLGTNQDSALGRFVSAIDRAGCLRRVAVLEGKAIRSRTLPGLNSSEQTFVIFRIITCTP